MNKRKKDKTIMEMFEEKKLQEQERKRFFKQGKVNENTTIIIEKKSKVFLVLYTFFEIIKILLRIVLVVIVGVLATIGGTVLMNESFREYFFQGINLIK